MIAPFFAVGGAPGSRARYWSVAIGAAADPIGAALAAVLGRSATGRRTSWI